MCLSRPVKFPILKLPFLCIECIIKSWNIFDIIFFALISQKSRQIVKHLKIPLNRIRIFVTGRKRIELANSFRKWHFMKDSETESLLAVQHQYLSKYPLVLKKNAIPLYTSKTDRSLISYSDGQALVASKMVMEFLNEMFKCSVERVDIYDDNLPESGDVGVKSTVRLLIRNSSLHPFDHAWNQKLSLLLENLEVTGTCTFCMWNTKNGYYVDPTLFKCKRLLFCSGSADWVTKEILLQFEVRQLSFYYCPFTVEDILSFVIHWFHSDNEKLEYLFILIEDNQISLEMFQTEELNPVPISDKNRVPLIFFALISKKTRQIVKHLKIPLNEIKICLSEYKQIDLNSPFDWHFKKESEADSWYEEQYRDFSEYSLVLQKDALPLYTKRMDHSLESYTDGKEVICLQMAMEFLKEVFRCSVEAVDVNEDSIPESGDIGVKSTVNLLIDHSYGNSQGQKLSLLLENLEVTDTCTFWLESAGQGFYVDPKRFKCKKLKFWPDSATWITREILLQFEVPRLHFEGCRFSEEDIAAFVTQWFHSDNRTFEFLYIELKDRQTFWEAFQDLNPIPFGGRARFILPEYFFQIESFRYVDFFKGLKIVRHDGLVATIHSKTGSFLFYIWHVQPANTQD